MGIWVQGFWLRYQDGLGFRVQRLVENWELGFTAWGLAGFNIQGSGLRVWAGMAVFSRQVYLTGA